MICASRRKARNRVGVERAADRGPRSGRCRRPARSAAAPAGSTVDLPQPDSPTSASVSPASTVKLTPSTARTWPVGRPNTERAATKCLTRPVDFEQRGHDTSLSSGARLQREAWPALDLASGGGAAVQASIDERDSARRSGSRPAGSPCSAPCPRWSPDARRGGRAAGSSRAGRRCRDAAGVANSSSTGARSTISPAYITATSSQTSATTPRSWVIRMIAAPLARLQFAHQVEDLRLQGDVERGGRLVGDQQARVAGQRHRDHDALAHAAGELVRIFVDALLGRGDVHAAQQLDGALARLPPRAAAMAQDRLDDLVADGEARIERGHRLLEDHGEPVAAQVAQRVASGRRADRSRRSGSRRETSADCFGSSPMMASEVTLLPQPDSPTSPSVAPLATREIDAVDGMRGAAVVAVEERRAGPRSRSAGLRVMPCPPSAASMPASMTARSVIPAGFSRVGRKWRKCTQRSRLTAFQPLQFGKRIGVVVDAQVELGPFLLAVDQQRGRLLAALVAAGGFAGLHRRDQAPREGQRCVVAAVGRAVSASTAAPASMLPATEKPSPWISGRTSRRTRAPVCAAMRPSASMTWSWRLSRPASACDQDAHDVARRSRPRAAASAPSMP